MNRLLEFITLILLFVGIATTAFAETDSGSDEPYKVYHFNTSGNPEIQANLLMGDLIVKKHDSDEVVVEIYMKRGVRILSGDTDEFRNVVQQRGNTIQIRTQPGRSGTSSDVGIRFVVYTPQEASISAQVTMGSMDAEGLTGMFRIKLTSGSLTMRDMSGESQVQITGGNLNSVKYRGSLMAIVQGGSATLNDFEGESRLQVRGGSLTVNNLSGAGMAEVLGGNIYANITHISDPVIYSVMGGDINVDISQKLKLDLTAKGRNLKIGKGNNWIRGVDDKSEEALYNLREFLTGHIASDEMILKVNGGGNPVQMNSASGTVKVTFK